MSEFTTAFPNSTKRDIEGPHGVRVPMREIALSGHAVSPNTELR